MKILPMSDLHLEFYQSPLRYLRAIDWPQADVLVLAGDIATATGRGPYNHPILDIAFNYLRSQFEHIIYVPGNHEYYGDNVAHAEKVLHDLCRAYKVHLLEPGVTATVLGQRFIGGTLWFPNSTRIPMVKTQLNDFTWIVGLEPWVYERNQATVDWLKQELKSTDVVVTHHLPSHQSVSLKHVVSPLNIFYVCDLHSLIEERQPKAWFHGHTHESCDYLIGKTRVVCNPQDYPMMENPKFKEQLIVEV